MAGMRRGRRENRVSVDIFYSFIYLCSACSLAAATAAVVACRDLCHALLLMVVLLSLCQFYSTKQQ
jgi:hypothetical protein